MKDSSGRAVAQSSLWLAADSAAWCFDNIEVLKGSAGQAPQVLNKRYEGIAEVYRQAAQQLSLETGLPVAVGTGFVPEELLAHFPALDGLPPATTKQLLYTDARKQLLVVTPSSETPAWQMESATDGVVIWRKAGGDAIAAQKEWRGGTHVTTIVLIEGGERDLTPEVLAYARSIAGSTALEVHGQDGTLLSREPGVDTLTIAQIVTSDCVSTALGRADKYGGSPLDALALGTFSDRQLQVRLDDQLTIAELASTTRMGAPPPLLL